MMHLTDEDLDAFRYEIANYEGRSGVLKEITARWLAERAEYLLAEIYLLKDELAKLKGEQQ